MAKFKSNIIGITLGDPAGIGPEVIAKALRQTQIRKLARFAIIGDYSIYRKYQTASPRNCIFIDVKCISPDRNIRPGKPDKKSAQASLVYLKKSIQLLKKKEITALVTGPVSKQGICSLGRSFQGHTEYLAKAFKIKRFGMMFVTPFLKNIIVTRHIPLNRVSRTISEKNVLETISLMNEALRQHFKIKKPRIAVCGLNPHAGEGGSLGNEEIKTIIPAIHKAKRKHIRVLGPFPADTLFAGRNSKHYDGIVAMYHDQGLIPIKSLYFTRNVNLTLGLPFIRTSPAHGTAFNIAGKNKADASSMAEAIRLAALLSK